MKAFILAGGQGKRLRPITSNIPKALVPVNGKPIIEWQINYFKKFGITEVVICAGYKKNKIIEYIKSKNSFDVKIEYSIEKTSLGTGGAIRNAMSFLDSETFFVINGDIITNIDPNSLKTNPNSIAAIPLRSTFGIIKFKENKISEFLEKTTITDHWMNAGIYYLSRQILHDLPKEGDIENTTFPLLAKNGKLGLVRYHDVLWHSVDSHKDIEECTKMMTVSEYEDFILRR